MAQTTTNVSQLPNIVNLQRKRGDTFPFVMTFTNSVSGTPIDLTGTTVTLTLNQQIDPTDATIPPQILQLSGVLSGTPTDGVATFTLTESEADQVGFFFYDVQRLIGTDKRTLAEGSFEFIQDITKD